MQGSEKTTTKAKRTSSSESETQSGSSAESVAREESAGSAEREKSTKSTRNAPLEIGGQLVKPGERRTIDIPLAAMVTHNDLQMTVHVIHGKQAGPVMFVSAAIHGDEINGVEIIRRVLRLKQLNRLKGTLIAIPVVNVHGFITHSRYLPDGRDLNRSFPGSKGGSLAARTAHTFLREVILKSTHGIDLHTGARHRDNLPQIRANLEDAQVTEMAECFGVPVIINSKIRDGSLREIADNEGIRVLLYEAGEALRFSEVGIRAGVKGIQNVMRQLGMLPGKAKGRVNSAFVTRHSAWIRAPYSGILRTLVPLGAKAEKGDLLGVIGDPLGDSEFNVIAPEGGIVIGRTNLPLVHEGDALFHLAYFDQHVQEVLDEVEAFQENLDPSYAGEEFPAPGETPIQ